MSDQLSEKLLRILELSADGLTVDQIAIEVHRSRYTIKKQRMDILEKLGADNLPQAVAIGLRRGLIR